MTDALKQAAGPQGPLTMAPFRWLVTGRFVAMLGSAIAPVALAFAVLDLTGSASDLGLVLAARSVPVVVFVLIGGVIADRFPRQWVLLTSNLMSAAAQAAIATMLLTGQATVGRLVALGAVNGAASALLWPALQGLTPQTVPAAVLQQANAVLRLSSNAAMIGGSAAGGILVAAIGPGWGLAIDATTYTLGALCLSRIRVPRTDRSRAGNAFVELRDGWTEFQSRTWVWVVVVEFAFVNLAISGGFNTLGPVVADHSIGRSGWGFVLASQTVGMVVGGLVALRIRPPHPLRLGVAVTLLEAPLLFLLAYQPRVLLLIAVGLLAGVGLEIFSVFWDLSMQRHIPTDRLSRVASYDALGSFLFLPIGQVLAGPLAAIVGVNHAIGLAATLVLVAVLASLATPAVRTLAGGVPLTVA
jgi:MFS family permease